MRVRTRLVLLLCLLACVGCGKKKSTNELIGDLKSTEERDRVIAVRTLPQRKGDAAQVVPALIGSLKDKEGDIRWSAAIGLGNFGEQAKDAIPALKEAARPRRQGSGSRGRRPDTHRSGAVPGGLQGQAGAGEMIARNRSRSIAPALPTHILFLFPSHRSIAAWSVPS